MKRFIILNIAIVLGAMFLMGSAFAQEENYIASGDSAWKKFDNQAALEYYKDALANDTGNYDALWRISRAYVDIGEHLPKNQQLGYYEKARLFADSAVTVNPNKNEGYTRRAIAVGRVALFKGVFKSIGLVKKVKADCEKALSIDPNDQIALYVFARSHQKVADKSKFFRVPLGLGWASNKKARKLYEKAIALEPESVMFNLDYARLLVKTKKYDEAKKVLIKLQSFPIKDEDDEENKTAAKKLLEEIKNK